MYISAKNRKKRNSKYKFKPQYPHMPQDNPASVFFKIYAIDCTKYGLQLETAQNPKSHKNTF